MKLALVSVSARGGGTERVINRLANGMAKDHQVSVMTLTPGEPFYPFSSGVSLFQPSRKLCKFSVFRKIQQLNHAFRVLRRLKPDVCCVFGEDIAGACCLLARLAGIPKVFVFCRGNPNRSLRGWNGLVNPIAFRRAVKVVVQTQEAIRQLRSKYRGCEFAVLANPIEIPSEIRPFHLRQQRVIYVASIGRKKNQRELIEAFAMCSKRKGWELVLVGDGPDRSKMESLAGSLGIEKQVKFLGERKDVAALLQETQICAFPSLSEGFPNALGEALANGCACISYDCLCGPSEMIVHRKNGLLVPSGDHRQFREHLDQLMTDYRFREELGAKAPESMLHLSEARVLRRFEELVSSG